MLKHTRHQTWKDVFWSLIMAVIAFVFAAIGYGVLVRDELLPEKYQKWKVSKFLGLIPSHWWTSIVFALILLTIIAVVERSHRVIIKYESDTAASFAKVEEELAEWKAEKPEIEVTIEKVIPKAPVNSVYDVFVEFSLRLKEPHSVSISSYRLTLQTPSGVRQSAAAVHGDISEWLWQTEIGETTYQFELAAAAKELSKRGEMVNGWLHFRVGPHP